MDYVEYFSKVTGHTFKNKTVLKNALTHSSYANEKNRDCVYNERLEFLGDSVLSLVVSEYLYKQKNRLAEGEMSKTRANLVCEKSLAQCAVKMRLGERLFLGKGEERTGGRERASVLADAVEALIAALYLDAGFEKAKEFVLSILKDNMEKMLNNEYISDYKTAFQELIQGSTKEKIEYTVIAERGPDHDKEFETVVTLDGKAFESGCGRTKKDAEQESAKNALIKMGALHE